MSSPVPPPTGNTASKAAKNVEETIEQIVKSKTAGYEQGSLSHLVVEKMTRLSVYLFNEPYDVMLMLALILVPLLLILAFCGYKVVKSQGKNKKKGAGPAKKGVGTPSSKGAGTPSSASSTSKPERHNPPRAVKKSKKEH